MNEQPGFTRFNGLQPGRRRRRTVFRACLAALAFILSAPVPAQDDVPESAAKTTEAVADAPLPPSTIKALADEADLIALVQVLDTDYEYTRDFPTGGTAFLRVLIRYKVNRQVPDVVEVYEEGLHEQECYFPTPELTEEGRRYLLFAQDNPEVEGQFLGLDHGCSLTVLVKSNNAYALRYPLKGLHVEDDLAALASPMSFSDSHALIDYETISVADRQQLLADGFLEERPDRVYKLTHGIELGSFRSLLGEENLTRDRTLLRPAPDPFVQPLD